MIYIIITTSILNKHGIINENHRKNRYIECIQQILKLVENDSSIKVIVVENNGKRQTYFDELNCEVFYTNNNNIQLPHKGVNELLDIKEVIQTYNIQDDDTIIKLTGRYKLLNLNVINVIKHDQYDAYVKFFNVCTKQFMYDDCVLGLFGIKCKYIKDFNYKCDKSPECEFAIHVRNNVTKLMEIGNLSLECCFADDLRILHV
jgi:hypothetical protein